MSTLNGKYLVERRLGGGGMAEVFVGRTVGAAGFSRPIAIKRILPGYSEQAAFTDMFVAEAQLTARLQHPNIVSVLDFDRDADGRLFLVMELVDGVDLDRLLGTGFVPLPVVVFVVREVLRGLAHAHHLPIGGDGVRGLVHRDVSPHNVLLSWDGEVKLSDFGIAKARAATVATATELIKGKPAYMSPEQANGEPLDGRSDLFAVGAMLWEMLCGRALFAGDTMQSTFARLLFAPIVPPRDLRADVPADLERITMRLLARPRAERYATADDVLAELRACGDDPRGGRELLGDVLRDRFPGRAPPRIGSTAPRAQPDALTRGPASAVPPVVSSRTLPGPAASAAIDPRGVRRARAWWAVLIVAALATSSAVVLRSREPREPREASGASERGTAPLHPVPVAPVTRAPPDAAPPRAVVDAAASATPAAPAPRPAPIARPRRRDRHPAPNDRGIEEIRLRP